MLKVKVDYVCDPCHAPHGEVGLSNLAKSGRDYKGKVVEVKTTSVYLKSHERERQESDKAPHLSLRQWNPPHANP